jgi:hypothetical protein
VIARTKLLLRGRPLLHAMKGDWFIMFSLVEGSFFNNYFLLALTTTTKLKVSFIVPWIW